MITLYGIPNCNTVAKARKWLKERNIEYYFYNFKKEDLQVDTLNAWLDDLGWEVLLNKRGTTWRKLPEEVKQDLNRDKVVQIMLANSSIIKRPLLDLDGKFYSGFNEGLYQELFSSE